MHPILANRRTLTLYLVIWLLIGLLIELPFVFTFKNQWISCILSDIPLNLLFAFICLSSYYICRFFPIRTTKWYMFLLVFTLGGSLATGIEILIGYGWIRFIDSLNLAPPIMPLYEFWLAGIFCVCILIFLLITAMHYVIIAYEQSKEAERRTLELQVLAQDAELRALRAQIDPHFLFNSLNSISALTASDPAKARSMTIMLGNFFRKSLDLSTKKFILLDDELSLISEFLTIEQVRFGQRLKIEQDVKEECRKVTIPPLLLQPLVENAVRHGIANLVDGGILRIQCQANTQKLIIQIENPIDPDWPKQKGTGLGLKNVRSRIDTIYGNEGRVDVEQTNDYYRVKLIFPIKRN